MDDGRFVFLDRFVFQLEGSETLPVVCFQRVAEATSGKNRLRIDLSEGDLDAETERVLALGGSLPDQPERSLEGFTRRTLADPECNEFDVATEG
ncbi:MAG: VOC family protein [Actinomycetota bacterium]